MNVTIICAHCGAESVRRAKQAIYPIMFCNRPCRTAYRQARQKAPYREVVVDGRRIYEHRHVASQMLGRELLPCEHVHHKDHNGLNNDPSNLEVLSLADHLRSHMLERYEPEWKSAAIEMMDAGHSFSHIAKALGLPYKAVYGRLKTRGYTSPKHKYPVSIDIDVAVSMLSNGQSLRSVGKALGTSHATISNNLIKAGYGHLIPPPRGHR